MKIDYSKLQPLDIVFCGGTDLFAAVIRAVTCGLVKTLDRSIPTHCGIVMDMEGQKFIGEMMPDGFKLNSLESYNKGINKPYIIGVHRFDHWCPRLASSAREWLAVCLRRTIGYDWMGDVHFLFPSVSNTKKEYFCSELVAEVYKRYSGFRFADDSASVSPASMYNCVKSKSMFKKIEIE
jgi:hypothetical protein